MPRYGCCEAQVPKFDPTRRDGEGWTCPACRRAWIWESDEAEGAWWALAVQIVAAPVTTHRDIGDECGCEACR